MMRKRNGLFLVSLSLPLVSKPYLHYYFWADLFCVGASYDEDRISLPVEDLWLRKQEYVRYKGGGSGFTYKNNKTYKFLVFSKPMLLNMILNNMGSQKKKKKKLKQKKKKQKLKQK